MESFDPLYVWSFGHQSLGLPKDFFHRYTLIEFYALRERYLEEQDHWPARIVAVIRNVNRGKDDRPLDPQDLMRTKRIPQTKRQLVNPDAFSSLRLFAKAHNAFLDQRGKKKTRTGGAR